LVSYVEAGLVIQGERSGAYDLGPLAVRVGLAALDRFDVVRTAGERLGQLRDEIEQTVLLSVWTDAGPTVARIELSRHPVTLAVRTGTAFPLLNTATGRVFLAFAPDLYSGQQIADEIERFREARVADTPRAEADVARLRDTVRAAGAATVDQTFLNGVCAVAVPLQATDGRLAAAITAIGRPGTLELAAEGREARALKEFARRCSAALTRPDARDPSTPH
jgi:DNA-binding IclR family transcriptional regulator